MLDSPFCVEAQEEALVQDGPTETFNTDQGVQFTSQAFTHVLKEAGLLINMDGKGCWIDNVFVERLLRSMKFEGMYLKAYASPQVVQRQLEKYFRFYNTERRHQSLNRSTLGAVYFGNFPKPKTA